ncbi:MAG: hypothetical protein CMP38_04930 [Rickettsiales bacterium]|nr:hypothetical protein [Rickettsiales bacterium]OUW02607.1 MAG: hypothetical protein CBD16_04015 [Betaproteobacteria bacterium TMED156]|tara:strand:- start:1102 stop:1335 length:234 start_codon:yes stop_codon:yes gene_type:complete
MLTNTDLIHILYEKLGKKHSQKDLEQIVEAVFEEITTQIKNGEEIHLTDFGTLALSKNTLKQVAKVNLKKSTGKKFK